MPSPLRGMRSACTAQSASQTICAPAAAGRRDQGTAGPPARQGVSCMWTRSRQWSPAGLVHPASSSPRSGKASAQLAPGGSTSRYLRRRAALRRGCPHRTPPSLQVWPRLLFPRRRPHRVAPRGSGTRCSLMPRTIWGSALRSCSRSTLRASRAWRDARASTVCDARHAALGALPFRAVLCVCCAPRGDLVSAAPRRPSAMDPAQQGVCAPQGPTRRP